MARRSVAGFKASATRQSRNAEVANNVDPGLRALFNRVGGGKGSLEQRTRRFQQYAHDHPSEVTAALQSHADRRVADMMAQPRASRPRWMRRLSGSPRQASSGGSLGGGGSSGIGDLSVPF